MRENLDWTILLMNYLVTLEYCFVQLIAYKKTFGLTPMLTDLQNCLYDYFMDNLIKFPTTKKVKYIENDVSDV